jgi:hypothetical protein
MTISADEDITSHDLHPRQDIGNPARPARTLFVAMVRPGEGGSSFGVATIVRMPHLARLILLSACP